MTIAVNACFLPHQFPDSDGHYIISCCTALAKQYNQHQFIFITDTAPAVAFPSAKNLSTIVTGPRVKSPLRLQYWLNYKLPAVLRKQQADILISLGCCSLRTKVKQCLLVDDLSFLEIQNGIAKNWTRYYKSNTGKFLHKAAAVIACSKFLKSTLVDTCKINDNKIDVIYKGVHEVFIPFSWQQKDSIKEQYTAGKEYFLYSGIIDTPHNLVNLLKAFSFFKKRQKSNMQLVLASTKGVTDLAFTKSLASYKYRGEVLVLEHCTVQTIAAITASAYAMVYPVPYEGCSTAVVEALHCGIPVITSNNSSMPEICGDAAVYARPDDFNDIADKMMLLFKDENKRNELIENGKHQLPVLGLDDSIIRIGQVLVNCIS